MYGASRLGMARVAPGDYSINKYEYELSDHLGNVRATFSDDEDNKGKAKLVNYTDYYPFGWEVPNRIQADNSYRFAYQGQFAEKDQETGFTQFEARLFDSRIGRWMSPDPAGQYHSPYLGMGNSPIVGVDPDGRNYNPIYDKNTGEFLGTDEFGLQGEAMFTEKGSFKQGMTQSEILASGGLFFNDLLSQGGVPMNFLEHYLNLKNRVDYDGFVTIEEGIKFAKEHPNVNMDNPSPDDFLYIDAKQLDFGNTYVDQFTKGVGQSKYVNLLYRGASRDVTYAYGGVHIKLISPHGEVKVMHDIYDWDYHSLSASRGLLNKSKTVLRNILIFGERIRAGVNDSHGVPIRTYGTGTIKIRF